MQDRELITRSHLSRRIDCGLTLEVWAEPNALPLHAGLFRIQESAGRWEALPQRDGSSTLVRLETYTNPGNNLPGWLVNPIAIKAAVGSFKAIRRLMEAEPRVAATPGLLGETRAVLPPDETPRSTSGGQTGEGNRILCQILHDMA